MEMFDAHRRDIFTFDDYMDLKKPGFGGPASAIALRDARGKKINKSPKLDGYQRTVERDPAFSHPVYNSTYKAMTHDLVYKQENKKPFKYTDPYRTAVPVIEYEPTDEGKSYSSFDRFVNEMEEKSLSQIENELRSYEGGQGEEEDREFGANPDDEDSKFDYIPGMPKELGMPDKETMAYFKQKASEFGANPRFRGSDNGEPGESMKYHEERFNGPTTISVNAPEPRYVPNYNKLYGWEKDKEDRLNRRRKDLY